ncbi:hypothetical protein PI125_g9877 [Phytophthora idaei]|nr:hypothetical protein PI125_g9877 [Phytophthora idaei]
MYTNRRVQLSSGDMDCLAMLSEVYGREITAQVAETPSRDSFYYLATRKST